MKRLYRPSRMQVLTVLTGTLLMMVGVPAPAQDYRPAPSFSPQQLDNLVSRIALYPDPLLAQVLAAATFPDQIPDAARWATDHRYLQPADIEAAIARDNLAFDPSVQALLPFSPVLDIMAGDMGWTSDLGNAVLVQRPDVMDAVQRMRREAESFGYLQSNSEIRVVTEGPAIEILPYDPAVIYVPVYDPYVVYAAPRPGFYTGAAIRFSSGFAIGAAFGNWGWGGGFNWYSHALIVHSAPWQRTWVNRSVYVHNYGNWNGGQWRNAPANRNVIVNRNVVVHDNVIINNRREPDRREFNNTANDSRVRDNNGIRSYTPPQRVANSYRPATPAPAQRDLGMERRPELERPPAVRESGNRIVERTPAPATRESREAGDGDKGRRR